MASLDELANLANVIGAVGGTDQKTRTKGTNTSTQQTDLSDDAVMSLVNDILAGPGGVRSIGNSARQAGVYNSTTEDQLLGDLYSRAATQGELARAPTTTTNTIDQTATTAAPGIGLAPLAGTLATTALAAPLVERASGALGGVADDAINYAGSLFGGGGGTTGTNAAVSSGLNSSAINAANSLFASQAGNAFGSAAQGALSSGAISAANQVAGANAGSALGNYAVPGAGSFLSGLAGGREASTDPTSLATAAATGFATMGPAGLIAGPALSIGGGLVGDAVGGLSIICTALADRGLLSRELYAAGQEYLATVSPTTKSGYYYWANGVADKISAGSKFWTAVCLPFARGRTSLLATKGTFLDHIRHPFGTATKYLGEPLCWLLGKFLELEGAFGYGGN